MLYPPQEWNFAGTEEFEFINARITSVIDKNGMEVEHSELLGTEVFSNTKEPFAKLVDLDVDFQVTTLFGLKFGLRLNGTELFVGNWTPCVIVNDMWQKVKCAKIPADIKFFSAQSTTKIVDITWSNSYLSYLINDFKSESQKSSNELQVSITLDSYNCDVFTIGRVYGTIGITNSNEPLCVGGERKMEPVDPGLFNFDDGNPCKDYPQEDQKPWTYSAPFKVDLSRKVVVVDLSNALPTYFASIGYQRVTAPLDLGDLYVGYILAEKCLEYHNNAVCIMPIGDKIPYLKDSMWKKSGVIEVNITGICNIKKIKRSRLVVFFKRTDHNVYCHELDSIHNYVNTTKDKYYVIDGYPTKMFCFPTYLKRYFSHFCSCTEGFLLLSETKIFVRPMGYYMARLENSSQSIHPNESFINDNHEFTLLVTKYGQPFNNTKVTVINSYNQFGDEKHMQLPINGVIWDEKTKTTNGTGQVTFKFTLNKAIPLKRQYSKNPNCVSKSVVKSIANPNSLNNSICYNPLPLQDPFKLSIASNMCTSYELPIDGQVYNFYYCKGTKCKLPKHNPSFLYKALLSILAFSDVNCISNCRPNWVDHVKDYFEQQHHLVYAMRSIMDLGNYTEVTLPHNLELLKYVLSKISKEDFDMDPNYMPTTRNLSPAKRNVILKWLHNPCFNSTVCNITETVGNTQMPDFKRCKVDIRYESDPQDDDEYLQRIIAEKDIESLINDIEFPPRPLFGLQVVEQEEIYPTLNEVFNNYSYHPICNLINLRTQLQQAVQLEFYTIPLYLTALYSIKEGYNTQAYQAIRNVVMQEMLHMVQAANILIAINGKVMIDDPKFAPSYPATGLPGHVLRNLTIHLKNYNLIHVHNTFMGIELPTPHNKSNIDDDSILYTIGMFYREIETCIKSLTNKTDIFKKPKVEQQVKWPWNGPGHKVGTVHIINDTNSSISGIYEIIEQGEGAHHLDPKQIDTGMYAHFYQFEELVCQKKLIHVDEKYYAFEGASIIYEKLGVYPMIDNPGKNTFQHGSRCYTQARVFHRVYRNMLQVLQKVFNGEPDKITEAVELMESLQVHAKRCMSIPYSKASHYHCGPVWDYEWD